MQDSSSLHDVSHVAKFNRAPHTSLRHGAGHLASRGGMAMLVRCLVGATACLALSLQTAHAQFDNRAIFVMKADGSGAKQLALAPNCGLHASPCWSRDGKRIAFEALPEDMQRGPMIYAVDTDGQNLQEIGPGARPEWSPDGKQIAFFEPHGPRGIKPGVWIMNADGNGPVWLALGARPRWSPDGASMVIVRGGVGGDNLVMQDVLEGTERSLLAEGYQQIWGVCWSPDGKRLALCGTSKDRTTQLAIVTLSDKPTTAKTRHAGEVGWYPSWSPDGTKILFFQWHNNRQGASIYTVHPDNDEPPVELPGQESSRHNTDAWWSPDGKQIVYAGTVAP